MFNVFYSGANQLGKVVKIVKTGGNPSIVKVTPTAQFSNQNSSQGSG